jgi:hypothetical protein
MPRHPALRVALAHGAVALVLLAAVVGALLLVPAGSPRLVAPALIGLYVVVTVGVMSSGVRLALRAAQPAAAEAAPRE